jgi:plastocyanin
MSDPTHFRRSTGVAVLALLLLVLAAPAAARAAGAIVAGPSSQYLASSVTIDQGEPLTFYNFDLVGHDVTAVTKGPDARPLFATPTIGLFESASVEGAQYLTTGSYPFFCSIHPFMAGSLAVTSAGSPVQRPTPATPPRTDTTRPTMRLKVRSASVRGVRRKGKLLVEVAVDEAAKVSLRASARFSGRSVTIAKGALDFTGAGKRRPGLVLTAAGRKALKKRSAVGVTLSAQGVDRTGNVTTAKVRRRLAP